MKKKQIKIKLILKLFLNFKAFNEEQEDDDDDDKDIIFTDKSTNFNSKGMPKFNKQKKPNDMMPQTKKSNASTDSAISSTSGASSNRLLPTPPQSLMNVFKTTATPTISYSYSSRSEIPSLLSLPHIHSAEVNSHQMTPAFLVEQSFENVDSNGYESNEPVKTLNQIRHEKIEQIQFISPQRPFKRPNVPTKTILDVRAREIQRRLSEQGKYVIWQEIVYELLNLYDGCGHIGELGLSQADHLPTINDLIRLQKRIDTFLIAYESRLPCVTLVELERSICNDYNYAILNNNLNNTNSNKTKVTKYEELFVGPIIRNQIIRQIFSLTDEVKSIEQMKPVRLISLLKHLENYLNEKDLWASKKIKQEDFEVSESFKYF